MADIPCSLSQSNLRTTLSNSPGLNNMYYMLTQNFTVRHQTRYLGEYYGFLTVSESLPTIDFQFFTCKMLDRYTVLLAV